MSQRVRAGADRIHAARRRFPWGWAVLALLLLTAAALWWAWRTPGALPEPLRRGLEQGAQQARQWARQLRDDERPAVPADPAPASAEQPAADAQASAPQAGAAVAQGGQGVQGDEQGHALDAGPAAPRHPIAPWSVPGQEGADAQARAALPELDASDAAMAGVLAALAGPQPVQALVRSDRFVRRFVATVDNLSRPRASAMLWPLHPTGERFTVQELAAEGGTAIAQANSARYAAAVALLHRLDAAELARSYRQHYPLFQQAYEELGYPQGYFNDRLVAVIDHLLQAPESQAPRVRLMPVRGQVPSLQPWVRYEFEDPQLEALSAGQKILVRIGPEHARLVKAKLRALRAEIAAPAAPAAGADAPPPHQ
ncbi:MAG: DUF3014 domain-containing protein [Comamonadaceae bacterium]|nr:DUF3014 domain-containing protein [Comamonadaceae bacterium]